MAVWRPLAFGGGVSPAGNEVAEEDAVDGHSFGETFDDGCVAEVGVAELQAGQGYVLDLPSGEVGVADACSGEVDVVEGGVGEIDVGEG